MDTSYLKSTFKRLAERYGAYRCACREAKHAKSFNAHQHDEAAFDTRDRGTRLVPLIEITGSVGRYKDFDRQFRPKSHLPAERLERIRTAMQHGKILPPIKLYQIKDEFTWPTAITASPPPET